MTHNWRSKAHLENACERFLVLAWGDARCRSDRIPEVFRISATRSVPRPVRKAPLGLLRCALVTLAFVQVRVDAFDGLLNGRAGKFRGAFEPIFRGAQVIGEPQRRHRE